jgi:hypothetical protein
MKAESGIALNSLIYCRTSGSDLTFTCDDFTYGSDGSIKCSPWIKTTTGSKLYLNYRDLTGAVKLYDSPTSFTISYLGGGAYKIYSEESKQVMWLDSGDEPYITGEGAGKQVEKYWEIFINNIKPATSAVYLYASNLYPMTPEDGKRPGLDVLIYCNKYGGTPFERIGPFELCFFRAGNKLYLNYRDITGAVKFYDSPAYFILGKLAVAGDNWYSIYSL